MAKAKRKTLSALEKAAIATSLHLFLDDDVHDYESGKLTINTVDRRFSPWNMKFFGFNNKL